MQVQKRLSPGSGRCYISVSPKKIANLTYRDYYMDDSGFFMVFNSYGNGDDSTTAGSRSFYLFPQTEKYPDYFFEDNNDLTIKMISGHELRISGKDFSIVNLSSAVIEEKPVSPNNNGGIEIKLLKGFWLDAGFRLGGTMLDNPNNKTVFKSAVSDKSCLLVNKTYLNYDTDGEFSMKLTGLPFISFLQKKCPELRL